MGSKRADDTVHLVNEMTVGQRLQAVKNGLKASMRATKTMLESHHAALMKNNEQAAGILNAANDVLAKLEEGEHVYFDDVIGQHVATQLNNSNIGRQSQALLCVIDVLHVICEHHGLLDRPSWKGGA